MTEEGGFDYNPKKRPVSAEEADHGKIAQGAGRVAEGVSRIPEHFGDVVEAGSEKAAGSLETATQALDDAWRKIWKRGPSNKELAERERSKSLKQELIIKDSAERKIQREAKRREKVEVRKGRKQERNEKWKKSRPWLIALDALALLSLINLKIKSGAKEAEESGVEVQPLPEQIFEGNVDLELQAYAMKGVETQSGYPAIKGVDDPNFLTSGRDMLTVFAAKYGASFLFVTYTATENGQTTVNINPILVEEMVTQTGYSQEYLESVWIQASKDPVFALSVLQSAPVPVNAHNLEFLEVANSLIQTDITPDFSQDRKDDLRLWLNLHPIPTLTPVPTPNATRLREYQHHVAGVEHGHDIDEADFNEAIGVVCDATGLDFASVRGSMETVAVCGGDAAEMVSAYAYVPNVHSSLAVEMEMSASAYILLPLYLLRIGHDMVKGLKGNIRSWLDKQQYRQMFDGLKERGKKFLTQKGPNNRDFS